MAKDAKATKKPEKVEASNDAKKGGVKVTKAAAAKITKNQSPKDTKPAKTTEKSGAKSPAKSPAKSEPKSETKATKVTKAPKETKTDAKATKPAAKPAAKPATKPASKATKQALTNLQKAQAAKKVRGKNEAPNNTTERIGCYLNVNIAKKYIREMVKNTLNTDLGTINAQYPYAALTELLFLQFVRSTVEFNNKNQAKADLYEITFINCRSAILSNLSFNADIREATRSYDPARAMSYVNTIYDNGRLRSFIMQKAFTNSTNLSIEEPALNFLCYLVSTVMTSIVRAACHLAEYGKQKNISIRSFNAACSMYFSGELGALVEQRMAQIQGEFSSKNEDHDAEDKKEENDNDEDNEDEENEEENEDGDDEENDEDNDDEDEDDENEDEDNDEDEDDENEDDENEDEDEE